MKKLIVVLLCLAVASPAFAMSLKYNISDGEIVSMGEMPDLSASAGERVVHVPFDIPKEHLSNFTFNGADLVRKSQTIIDKERARRRFSTTKAEKAFLDALGKFSSFDIRFELSVLIAYAEQKDFDGLKTHIEKLEAETVITEADVVLLNAIFAGQNISMNASEHGMGEGGGGL